MQARETTNPSTLLVGSDVSDALTGTSASDHLVGGAGADVLRGNLGRNILEGGIGRDLIILGPGEDTVDGGADGDFIGYFGPGFFPPPSNEPLVKLHDSLVWGFDVAESASGDYAVSQVRAGLFYGGRSVETFANKETFDFSGDHHIIGGGGDDLINAGRGNDVIYGDGGPDAAPVAQTPLTGVQAGKWSMAGGLIMMVPWSEAAEHNIPGHFGANVEGRGPNIADGWDSILGGGGEDTIFGQGGNDILAGGDGADYVDGGSGDDLVLGEAGADSLIGGDGNDRMLGDSVHDVTRHGDDYMDGGSGVDSMWGEGGSDTLYGGDGDDYLDGDADDIVTTAHGADYLDGGAGDDTLWGRGGNDELFGGAGTDRISGGEGDDYLDGEDGNDLLTADAGADEALGGAGDDKINGGAGNDTLDGEAGADELFGEAGEDKLFGGVGDDYIDGGGDNDFLEGEEGSDTLFGGAGNDTISGGVAADTLSGDDGNDVLFGGSDGDFLTGGAGDDELNGGMGNDALAGGAGNDVYVFNAGDGQDTIRDTEGSNRIRFADVMSASTLVIARAYNGADITIQYSASDAVTAVGGGITQIELGDGTLVSASELLSSQAAPVTVNGTSGADYLYATEASYMDAGAGDDQLQGSASDDVLLAGAGNDYIWGGMGNDIIDGGPGDDYLYGQAGSDTYRFGFGSGSDIISDDPLIGEYNVVQMGAGVLPSDVSISSTFGMLTLALNNAVDRLSIGNFYGEGQASGSFALPTGATGIGEIRFQNGTVWDAATIAMHANAAGGGRDVLQGMADADTFHALGGDDSISGNSGDDALYGDEGNDQLQGGWGSDYLLGGLGDDYLQGNEGPDILDGGAGTDQLLGGDGDDIYVFRRGNGIDYVHENDSASQTDTIVFGAGIQPDDIVVTSSGSGSVELNIRGAQDKLVVDYGNYGRGTLAIEQAVFENGTIWTAADILKKVPLALPSSGVPPTEPEPAQVGDHIQPGSDRHTITGTGAADVLAGYGSMDWLIGYSGDDRMSGNDGDDRLDGGRGNDTLSGGSGMDQLNGGEGIDTLDGGFGDDALDGGAGDDIYVFARGGGHDSIYESVYDDPFGLNTIKVGPGIVPQEVTVSNADANSRFLLTLDTGESISVYSGVHFRVRFEDGTVWNTSPVPVLQGTAADEVFSRTGPGSIPFGHGSGHDQVFTGLNVLSFKNDVRPEQVIVRGQALDTYDSSAALKITLTDSGDTLLAPSWFVQEDRNKTIVEFRFADGTTWDVSQIKSRVSMSGTAEADYLLGTGAADTLSGLGSNDVIRGMDGNDTLFGGDGRDQLDGGAGNDVITGGSGNDTLVESAGDDRYLFSRGFGSDTLEMRSVYGGDAGSGYDRIEFDSTITPAQVVVQSDKPYDTAARWDLKLLIQGTDDAITITQWMGAEGRGIEEVRFADGTVWNAAALNARATVTSDLGEIVDGTALGDTLDGRGGDDRISGHAGDDTLNGGGGIDLISGDAGNDIIDGGAGDDQLYGAIGDDRIFGGAGNDRLDGGYGNDVLDGGIGADTMVGGAGNDAYIVDNVADRVDETLGSGVDTVRAAISYVLGAGFENLALTGLGAIDGSGNTQDNAITGNAAANVLTGLAGNDMLDGSAGADRMAGGAGNDLYVVDNASDVILELVNEGVDTVQSYVTYTLAANVENLSLVGTAAVDGTGNALNNVLKGNSAANVLNGGAGADAMSGAGGDDTYVVDSAGDVVTEAVNEGNDSVRAGFSYTLGANVENLVLTGTAAIEGGGNALDNVIVGNAATNVLRGAAGNDTLDGGAGADTMVGGAGDDTYVIDNAGDVTSENANEGVDKVRSTVSYSLGANIENLVLEGSAAIGGVGNALDNVITGNTARNALTGGAGNDVLDGLGGGDTLAGGVGNDVYSVYDSTDVVIENVNEGVDTVRSMLTYTLGANLENLTLLGNIAADATGNALDNILIGNVASNRLGAAGGNDTLDGGAGADTLAGGMGNDNYVVDNIADVVIENANEGTDTVSSSVTYSLSANVEHLTLTGTAAINGTGNALSNTLRGNSAANQLDGGAGADTLIGGSGNDIYVVDNAADLITENAGEGTDTVLSYVTYVLAPTLENLTLLGTAATNGTGNGADNILIGNGAANVLNGAAGNDVINGGIGADTMAGGTGNDVYVVDNVADSTFENAGEGTDTVQSSVTYALAANIENLTLAGTAAINGTGNALDNVITGNKAVNTLAGGLGNDTYVIDNALASIVEAAGAGIDTVRSSVTFTLAANVENLTLVGSAAINGTGNALDNVLTGNSAANALAGGAGNDTYIVDNAADLVIEAPSSGVDTVRSSVSWTLGANVEHLILLGNAGIAGTGNALDNILIGNAGANVLTGGAGNDLLDGGAGSDSLIGGAGNDTYVIESAGDRVTENPDEGFDTVSSSIAYVLAANIENLTLTGSGAINGLGNALNNVITGNSSSNTLDGAAGADTMTGGGGDDTYIVDSAADSIVEKAGEGVDVVRSSVSYALSANVENLVLTGVAAIDGAGNTLNNALTGNAANNVLDGGAGADAMAGGLGNDTYVVDNAADVVIEGSAAGIDTVRSAVTYALGANVENLTLVGSASINGTGNALNNILTGNSAVNTLAGGSGNDTYIVDSTLDILVENVNDGIDTVESSVSFTLGANLENLTLTGVAAIGGTGNALDNALIGNGASNALNGGAGNDMLSGGAGADTLIGGTGNDTFIVENTADVVIERAGEGLDTVQTFVTYTLSADVENLVLAGSAAIGGTGNAMDNVITGNAAANALFGGAGNDTLNGGAGADALAGGLGNDVYIVDDADIVRENVGEGMDTVQASVSYTLVANVETLVLTGVLNISGRGNALDNVLTGNSGNNTLDGAAGADSMRGGLGNDTYLVDNVADTVIENAGAGLDTVQTLVTYALTANVENITLIGTAAINAYGNALDNVLTANAATNTLAGAGGNDTYVLDSATDVVLENAGDGTDTVTIAGSYTLTANVENLLLLGTGAFLGTGNALDNSLIGNAGNNTLSGAAGNDRLDGALGQDRMLGGIGNDTYVVDDIGDVVVENIGEGADTVESTITYALGANLENLKLTGRSATNGIGNELANAITGNTANNALSGGAGNDVLNGGLGADTMKGGLGDDTYIIDTFADVVVENANEGTDSVQSVISYTLGANVENLALTGVAAVGTGNALNNMLVGNGATNLLFGFAGNDRLDGGAGIDTLVGGVGDDTYFVDNAQDVVVENAAEGLDTIYSSVTITALSANVENATLLGAAAIDLTGNALANELRGNSGANAIDGGDGADRMFGGAGDDRYIVRDATDVAIENANEGIDTVYAYIDYTLPANFENLVLNDEFGLARPLNGTGNASDNVVTGNGLANRLVGAAGNDVLDGRAGTDTLIGGTGNDTYYVESVNDVVLENANEGIDAVYTNNNYALPQNLENLYAQAPRTQEIELQADHARMLWGTANYWVDAVGKHLRVTNGESDRLEYLDLWGNDLGNIIVGSDQKDWIEGNAGNDKLSGGKGNDWLLGGAGNDVLDGGSGADSMLGGLGDDVYVVDAIGDNPFESYTRSGWADGSLPRDIDEGNDTVLSSITFVLPPSIENLTLTGAAAIDGSGNGLNNTIVGNDAANALLADAGADILRGAGGNDLLDGGVGADIIAGDAGNDVLQGSYGEDVLSDTSGNNVFDGGADADTLTGSTGSELFIGGSGNDTVTTGAGNDIIAFNRGDGQDVVKASTGADNTLSLGGGIAYADMKLAKTGGDLILNLGGSGDRITFKDWYALPGNHSLKNLQVIAEAMQGYSPTSTDKLLNRKVETFDFQALAAKFDTAGAPTDWALTNALLEKHLSGSDTAAFGGDLAYQYGKSGSLAAVGFDAASGLLASATFGAAAQALQSSDKLTSGVKHLS